MEYDPLTVLVVDDELPLRQELRLFPWEAYQTELIGEAENGEEALQFCRSYSPDIVITDITMPVMNGLELFRRLKSEFPHIQVILLTCHSEFAFAQEAIKLGAVEYLVKVTMDDDDLERALQKARERAEREKSLRRRETDQLRWEASRRLLHANGEMEAFLQASFQLKPPFHLAALHAEAGQQSRVLLFHEIEDVLTLLEPLHSFIWVPTGDGVYLLMFQTENYQLQFLRNKLEKITAELYNFLDRNQSFLSDAFRLYSVVSEPVRHGEQMASICRSVCERPVAIFYDSTSRVFTKQWTESASLDGRLESDMLSKLRKAQWNREQLVQVIHEDFVKWAIKFRIVPEQLRAFVADWLREWQRGGAVQGNGWRSGQRIANASTITELAAAMIHEIETLSGSKKTRKEISEAKKFIIDNLKQPITLTSVSEYVGLSPHYLSRLFREETGTSFNDYISKKRIERATHLLQNTSLRVYEVAQEVGIPSYRYFSTIFREWTGVAPTEVKKHSSDTASSMRELE